jgi:acetolactate synthase I/II/III large subunit
VQRLLEADVVLAVGTRLNEYTSAGYRLPATHQQLLQVDLAAEVLGGHGQAAVPIVSDAGLFATALLRALEADPPPAALLARRRAQNAADRARWEAETTPRRGRARPGYVDQQAVVAHLRRMLPADAIVTTDAGNFGQWPARYLRWHRPGTFLGPTSGAMGYAVPAALAAKLARPSRQVVAFVGDGGFLMTGPEVETAVRVRAPFVSLVYDNGQYGTIRMHQERDYPGRPVATALGQVDFAEVGRGLGALGLTVRDDGEFPAAFEQALAADRPAVVHLRVDPEQISAASDAG